MTSHRSPLSERLEQAMDHCPLTSNDIGDHRHRNRHLIHDRHVKHVNLHNGLL